MTTNSKYKSIKSYFHHQRDLSGGKAGRNPVLFQNGQVVAAEKCDFPGKSGASVKGQFSGLFF
jgi:hypothetical protein